MASIMLVSTLGNFTPEETQIALIRHDHVAQIINDRETAIECLKLGRYDFVVTDDIRFLLRSKSLGQGGSSLGVHSKMSKAASAGALVQNIEALLNLTKKYHRKMN